MSDVCALSEVAARALTDQIKVGIEATWQLVAEAYLKRADQALGYPSWDAYVIAEVGPAPMRVPREDRPELVRSLRTHELSLRAIASVLGVSELTVRRDLDESTAADAAVEESATVVVPVYVCRIWVYCREPAGSSGIGG
jgi:DNA invertase Pin-like site-specific DNA recombinase